MTQPSLRIAALGLAVSGVLHLVVPIFGGFTSWSLTLAGVGIVYIIAAVGLLRGLRWLAYVSFMWLLIGTTVAFISSYGAGAVPAWMRARIVGVTLVSLSRGFSCEWRAC